MKLLRAFFLFAQNTLGCINNPYVTYRKLSDAKNESLQIVYIFLLAFSYFSFASLLRAGLHNPYLLTLKFNSLLLAGSIGFFSVVFTLYGLGHLVGGKGTMKTIVVLWSYSLLPTVLWFFFTSLMYILLPPPRTFSMWGKSYSVLFITLSMTLLGWKLILYYLTLRFGMRLNLGKILIISLMFFPAVAGYSMLMYRLGIFRIPFL